MRRKANKLGFGSDGPQTMDNFETQVLGNHDRWVEGAAQAAIVIGASLFVALCARFTVPLPFTPVPLTMQNLGVLLVGLSLGSRRGFLALVLYLAEGLAGMPVFSLAGPGGIAQLLGPTGGFLLAYPFVAGIAGWIFESGKRSFARAAFASFAAEVYLFVGGLSWLTILTHSFTQAIRFGLYWFVFAEVIKIMSAAAIASGWQRFHKAQSLLLFPLSQKKRQLPLKPANCSSAMVPLKSARSPSPTARTPTTLSCFTAWRPIKSACPACVSRTLSATLRL
jgi:biotin transport system substrate-specific component